MIWILADQNRALKAALVERRPASRDLTPGEQIPDLQLQSALDRKIQTLDYLVRDGIAVIGLMTTSCPFCEQNLGRWSSLASSLHEWGVPFFAIAFDDPDTVEQYWDQHDLDWPLWASAPGSLGRPLAVPTTAILSQDRAVMLSVTGVLTADAIIEIQQRAKSFERVRGTNE